MTEVRHWMRLLRDAASCRRLGPTGGLMKVGFVVALVGSAIGFAASAFADEAPAAPSSAQAGVPVDSVGPTPSHQAIKDHHPKRAKKPHPKTPAEASSKSALGPS